VCAIFIFYFFYHLYTNNFTTWGQPVFLLSPPDLIFYPYITSRNDNNIF